MVAIAWLGTGWTPAPVAPPQAIGPAVNPAAPAEADVACHVEFAVTQTGGSRFTAVITVTNHDDRPIPPGWQLRFDLPQRNR